MPKLSTRPVFTDSERSEASRAVETAVRRIVQVEHPADTAMVTEPIYVGAESTVLRPQPLQGIRAARLAKAMAVKQIREHAKRARSQGVHWGQIAAVLVEPSPYDEDNPWKSALDDMDRAFKEVADFINSRDYEPSFSWKCAMCGQLVTERIPSDGDIETGHADNCARAAAELAARAANAQDEDDE
jgi:hypothetical protein